jgi:hypothetical protein
MSMDEVIPFGAEEYATTLIAASCRALPCRSGRQRDGAVPGSPSGTHHISRQNGKRRELSILGRRCPD